MTEHRWGFKFWIRVFSIRIATETIESMRCKLRCFRIPVEDPAELFFDNMSAVKNSSIPTSALNEMHNSICYHRFRGYQDAGILRVGWIPGDLTRQNCLQIQKCLGIQGVIWLIQSSLTQHPQLVTLRRRRFICTWVYLSTSHTTRVFVGSGFWACIYIFDSNQSYIAINFRVID